LSFEHANAIFIYQLFREMSMNTNSIIPMDVDVSSNSLEETYNGENVLDFLRIWDIKNKYY
jgi:hypothetical protein